MPCSSHGFVSSVPGMPVAVPLLFLPGWGFNGRVITLAGNAHASRVGTSLLSNVGLPELIAKTHEEYVKIAVNLANDINRLQSLYGNLRNMMIHSSLTNAKQFTYNLEKCYFEIWGDWCKSS